MKTNPKELRTEKLIVRITPTQRQKLDAFTTDNETSAAQLLRKLLNDFLN